MRHTPTCGTYDMPGCFKEWKACLMEIEQTAHQLETNAHANFTMTENAAYQYMRNGGGNMPTLTFLWLTVCFRYNVETKSRT